FEALRDALLAVAGRLDPTVGGPPVRNPLAPSATRRTLYSFIDRLNVPGLLRTFDFPSPDATSPQRTTTTVAPQALFLMNNPFVLEQARRVLKRSEVAAETDGTRKIARLHCLVYGRLPAAQEQCLGVEFMAGSNKSTLAWERYVQALLLTNEFVFVD